MLFLVGVLLLIASAVFSQTTTQPTTASTTTSSTTTSAPLTPPNCDCSDDGNTDDSGRESSAFAWFGRRQMKQHDKTICGTNGQTYSSKCQFINAQAQDESLGMRPCANASDSASREIRYQGPMNEWNQRGDDWGRRPMHGRFNHMMMRQKSFCMTDGTTFNGTMSDKEQYLQQNTDAGVRCHGECPCQLECPQPIGFIQEFVLFLW